MTTDSRQKRSKLGYQRFLFSALCTLFFLFLYLLGSRYIPAPKLHSESLGEVPRRRLLSSILDYQIQTNFAISILSAFSTAITSVFWKRQEIEQKQKLGNALLTLSKFLKPNLVAFSGILNCWSSIKNSPYLLLSTYFSFFVSNSVFELIIEFLNDYGICRGFELILCVDKFPFKFAWELFLSLFRTILFTGNYSDLRKVFSLLFISIIIYLFVSMLNRR